MTGIELSECEIYIVVSEHGYVPSVSGQMIVVVIVDPGDVCDVLPPATNKV
jgi:hypothetical protein